MDRRFPIVSGLSVVWDSRKPPNQRVQSIHLIKIPDEDDDAEGDDDDGKVEEIVDFVDQEDGTRIEVRRKGFEKGEEVKNEAGGRIYRIVRYLFRHQADCRSRGSTWRKGTTVSSR